MRLVPIAALLLGACAGLQGSPEPDRRSARQALNDAAAAGPVPLVVLTPPAGLGPATVAETAAEGVTNLPVGFMPAAASGAPRLVLWFAPPPGAPGTAACLPAAGADRGPPGGLLAVFCEGTFAVAEVRGEAAPDPASQERLIWRSTNRLFPDDYPETYGFDLFGWRIGLGASVGL